MTLVSFDYYAQGETGNDDYRFDTERQAREKFAEFKAVIQENFAHTARAEVIDEEGVFGMRDPADGSWARVTIEPPR